MSVFSFTSNTPLLHRPPPLPTPSPQTPSQSIFTGKRWKRLLWETRKFDILWLLQKLPIFCHNCFIHVIYLHLRGGWGWVGRWRTCRLLSFRIKGSRTHLVGWNAAGPLALIAEIILPLMTPTYSEISLLKLVLADYLQVLELHLFAILQMWKTLMPGRGAGSGEKSILIPGITTAASVNRPGKRPAP